MNKLNSLENIAVRVMYFFNVIDTFLPFSVLVFLLVSGRLSAPGAFPVVPVCFVFLWCCFKIAEFHVYYLVSALFLIPLFMGNPVLSIGMLWPSFLFFLAFTSVIQLVFMGLPMGAASRSPWVPIKMYLNSFAIIAPTTISLPVTLGYQFLMTAALQGISVAPLSRVSFGVGGAFLACAFLARRIRKGSKTPAVHHPANTGKKAERVVLLNLDGVSHHAFQKAEAPFLRYLERNFMRAPGGASTVYKAFTNPAFASILTGAEQAVHGVTNNNFGQAIRVEALPDFIKTRLYGSMHVKHFSRECWQTEIVSLVVEGHDRADAVLMDRLKKDMPAYPDVEFWVVDLSLADYCGHAWGAYSKAYYQAIARLDALIRDFMEWCSRNNFMEDTLFIISSDHGMFIGEHAYMLSPKEKYVPLLFVGKHVPCGELGPRASILDIAANVSYALGKPYCKSAGGRVFDACFTPRSDGPSLAERLPFSRNQPFNPGGQS